MSDLADRPGLLTADELGDHRVVLWAGAAPLVPPLRGRAVDQPQLELPRLCTVAAELGPLEEALVVEAEQLGAPPARARAGAQVEP